MNSQDKLYFLDGTTKTGKVVEIAPEHIILRSSNENNLFPRTSILLIEFTNGTFDKINSAEKEVTAKADKKENFHFKQQKKEIYNFNQVSVNSLALCNADITAFYERILPNKKFGMGVMGAYNFNQYANNLNLNIAVLTNAKKNYDLGGFFNFYPAKFEKRTCMHFGMMIKYTSFNFSSEKDDSTKTGNLVSVTTSYKPAKGAQLATLFTLGTHTDITSNFFIKTLFGFGAFKLHGDYKSQYNLIMNKQNNQSNNGTNSQPLDYHFLPKFYFGINLGFKL